MKKLFAILFLIILGIQSSFSQGSGKLEAFRENVLPEYDSYFSQADLTANGRLNLTATPSYIALSGDDKGSLMTKIFTAWPDSLIHVHYLSKREVWGRSEESGSLMLLDEFDLSAPTAIKSKVTWSRPHPWFFYVGGQLGGDNQHNINFALNLRLGFFLLLNRWDLATTLSGGFTGNTTAMANSSNATPTGWSNIGFMTRVHFPIRKIGLSPNVGVQVTMATSGSATPTINGALVAGASWFVGIGSLDISFSFGNIVTGSMGYTMYPQARSSH
jgi:hypothetical protein